MHFRHPKQRLVQPKQRYKRVKQRINLTKQRVFSDKTKKKREQAAFDLLPFNLYCYLS